MRIGTQVVFMAVCILLICVSGVTIICSATAWGTGCAMGKTVQINIELDHVLVYPRSMVRAALGLRAGLWRIGTT